MSTHDHTPAEQESPTRVYLHPGQICVSLRPMVATTVLGSCVSVCLFDPSTRIGGINHYLLPHWAGDGCSSARYGNVAMRSLLDRVLGLGADAGLLEAKVFGGACVLGAAGAAGRLGAQNVRRALEFLEEVSVRVSAQSTGGTRGRKVVFSTVDGSVWMKEL